MMLLVVSCKVSDKISNTSTNDETTIESPKLIFLNYSIENDTIQQDYRIRLINMIIVEAKIKDNTLLSKTPAIDDLEYTILDKESQVLMRNFIANPLNRTIEYVSDNGQLAKKDIQLDSTRFSIRIPLAPDAKYIALKRYIGSDSKSIHLLTTDIH